MGSLEGWREESWWHVSSWKISPPPDIVFSRKLREIGSPKIVVVLGFHVTFPDAPCHSTSQCWSCLTERFHLIFDNAFVFCLLANMAWSMHMPNSRWHEMELTYGLQIFQQNPGSVEIKKTHSKLKETHLILKATSTLRINRQVMYMSRKSPNKSLLKKVFFSNPRLEQRFAAQPTLRLQGYEPSAAEAFGIEKMEGGVTRVVQVLKKLYECVTIDDLYVCIYIYFSMYLHMICVFEVYI